MYSHYVQYYETDRMGITHHSNYVRWMEEARTDFLAKLGWPYDRLEAEGIVSPTVSIDVKYKKTTTYADTVYIDVVVEEYKGLKIVFAYKMTKEDGTIVCEAHSSHCFIDEAGRPLKVVKISPALDEAITSHIGVHVDKI